MTLPIGFRLARPVRLQGTEAECIAGTPESGGSLRRRLAEARAKTATRWSGSSRVMITLTLTSHATDTSSIFQMPWQRIVSGAENLAASHETLATKIETDVENPLRHFASRNREMQALSTTQGNLNSLAKELVNAQRRAAKGGRKAESASSTVEDSSREWESQAPYVFEQLQALDETRVNHLRDVLTQYQTHELDATEKNRLSAESCLNALLNIETADEIKTFAARASGGRGSVPRRRSSAAAGATAASSHLRPPTPPPPRNADDRQSQRTNSFAAQDRLAPCKSFRRMLAQNSFNMR